MDEVCSNCCEETDDIELMCHDGLCKVCYDDGVDEEDE